LALTCLNGIWDEQSAGVLLAGRPFLPHAAFCFMYIFSIDPLHTKSSSTYFNISAIHITSCRPVGNPLNPTFRTAYQVSRTPSDGAEWTHPGAPVCAGWIRRHVLHHCHRVTAACRRCYSWAVDLSASELSVAPAFGWSGKCVSRPRGFQQLSGPLGRNGADNGSIMGNNGPGSATHPYACLSCLLLTLT
jgi:hypothetical protein